MKRNSERSGRSHIHLTPLAVLGIRWRSIRLLGIRVAATTLLLPLSACSGPKIPQARTLNQAKAEQLVREELHPTHPRPAALPEVVPDAPSEEAVWLHGHWCWQQDQWVWKRGGWVHLPEGYRWVPGRTFMGEGGALVHHPHLWVNAAGEDVQAPEIARSAATPPVPRLPEGSTVP